MQYLFVFPGNFFCVNSYTGFYCKSSSVVVTTLGDATITLSFGESL